jgi:hypothetical protein
MIACYPQPAATVWSGLQSLSLLPRRNLSHLRPPGVSRSNALEIREQPIAGGPGNAAAMLTQWQIDHIASHRTKAVRRSSPQLIRRSRRSVSRHHCSSAWRSSVLRKPFFRRPSRGSARCPRRCPARGRSADCFCPRLSCWRSVDFPSRRQPRVPALSGHTQRGSSSGAADAQRRRIVLPGCWSREIERRHASQGWKHSAKAQTTLNLRPASNAPPVRVRRYSAHYFPLPGAQPARQHL